MVVVVEGGGLVGGYVVVVGGVGLVDEGVEGEVVVELGVGVVLVVYYGFLEGVVLDGLILVMCLRRRGRGGGFVFY